MKTLIKMITYPTIGAMIMISVIKILLILF